MLDVLISLFRFTDSDYFGAQSDKAGLNLIGF